MASSTSSPQQLPANLALCSQGTSESQVPSCLEWETETSSAIFQPTSSTATNQQQLQWRFEEGLLRFVGDDGFATSLCLGPKTSTLFSNAFTPYELVLQTCPGMEGTDLANPKENIFSHHASGASAAVNSAQVGFEEQKQQALSIQQESEQPLDEDQLLDRHMRFLIGGDGRIRSLATVLESNNSSSDLVAERPFCVTAASSKAYLVPCMLDKDETHVYSNAKETTTLPSPRSVPQMFVGDQQILEPTANSFYDSFLLDWKNTPTSQHDASSTVQLAYQIGFQGPDAPITASVGPSPDDYDSFSMRVKAVDRDEHDETSKGVFETTLGSGETSGVRTYPTSTFGCKDKNGNRQEATTLGAYLVGKSSDENIPPGLLASTSFLVYSSSDDNGTQDSTPTLAPSTATSKFFIRLPWAHIFLWGFIIFFAILIKVHKICRPRSSSTTKDPKSKNVLRASHLTVDTSAASQGSQHLTPSPTTPSPFSSSHPLPLPPPDFIIHHHQKRRRSSRGSFSHRDNSRRSQTSISVARCALQAQEQLRFATIPPSSFHSRSFQYSPTTNLAPCSSHSRRALYEWDGERPARVAAQIDSTQTTVNTNDEVSEVNYMDEDAGMLCNSDIEDGLDDEYDDDDDDIEARR